MSILCACCKNTTDLDEKKLHVEYEFKSTVKLISTAPIQRSCVRAC